ncbi:DsbA family protein [Azotobacter vinelandii]
MELGRGLPWCPLLLVVALLGTVAILAYLHQEATRSETGPWPLGEPDARWTITEYADLECPYCKTYTPDLKRWVGRHPQVNLQWHHVPLPGHGQAAVHEARLVQCAGVHGGREAFWTAIDQVLARTGSNGLGFTGPLDVPNVKPDVLELCADTDPGIALLVEQQRIEAKKKRGIQATPSVEITDNRSGRSPDAGRTSRRGDPAVGHGLARSAGVGWFRTAGCEWRESLIWPAGPAAGVPETKEASWPTHSVRFFIS